MSVVSDAESVKASLASSAATTSVTVETLTHLLNGANTRNRTAGPIGSENSARASSKPRVKNAFNERKRLVSAKTSELQPLERVKLATEVVNICLKTLSQAVQAKGRSTKPTSPQKSSTSTEPFTPRQPNIPTNPTKLIKNSDTSNKEDGIDSVAECARVALGALRRHNDQCNAQTLPELQLELAISAVIAKLIALEMVDLASKEIRILTKRLDMGSLDNMPPKKAVPNGQSGTTASVPSLAELLHLQHLPDTPPKLSLIFATQMHILRLLQFAKLTPNPFDLYKNLEPATLSSPYNLLDALIAIDGKEKCVRHLNSLAHAISSIADRISSKIDKSSKSKLDLSHGVLQLRILGLEILSKSWNLAGHNVDVHAQLCRPLKRYTENYLSFSTTSVENRFTVITSAMERFANITGKMVLSKQQKRDLESAVLDINQMLYKLSKATGNHKQSKDLAVRAVSSLSQTEVSGFRKGSLVCQLATIMLQDIVSVSKDEVCEALNKALQYHSASADGSSEDLDELLISISNLRKAATTVLAQSSLRHDILEEHHRLFCLLRDCVLKSPAFVVKYLGASTEAKMNSTASVRYAKRKSLALKVGRATIESVAAVTRLDAQLISNEWRPYEQSLVDCNTLQKRLSIDDVGSEVDSAKVHTPIPILISNAYWFRYLALRQSKDITQMILLLENSVEQLQELSIKHQELGLFPNKLERLAYLQEQNRNWEMSSKLYIRVFDYLYRSQIVQIAAEKLRWTPMLASLLEDDKFKLIGKAIDGFCRTMRHLGNFQVHSLCPDGMQPALQGFTLELQLVYLKKYYEEAENPVQTMIERLSSSLLEIYTEGHFPIRRIRALASLAQCNILLESESGTFEHSQAFDESERTLLPFHDHLIARRNAILSMKHITDSKLLSTALKQWIRLISQKSVVSRKALLQRVDDVQDWLGLLSTIADFTDAHRLIEQRAITLDLLAYANRTLSDMNAEVLVLHTSCLATELIELGSMDQAHSLLLQNKNRFTKVTNAESYHWHIAMALFYVKTGNAAAAEATVSTARIALETIVNGGSKLHPIEIARIKAQYHHISAKHQFILGHVTKSIYHIKQSVRLLLQAWAMTERKCGRLSSMDTKFINAEDDSTLKAVDDDESSTPTENNSDINGKSAKFWSLIRPLFESLMDASMMFSHAGLVSESRYYVLEALKIAKSISASVLRIRALLLQGTTEIRSGDQALGIHLYKQARNILQSCRSLAPAEAILLDVECTIYSVLYDNCDDLEMLEEACASVDKLTPMQSLFLQTQDLDLHEVASKMETLEISTTKKSKPKASTTKNSKAAKKVESRSVEHVSNQEINKIPYQHLRSRLLLTKASVLTSNKEFDTAMTTVEEAVGLSHDLQSDLHQAVISTKLHLEQGLKLLEFDPILNIIPEAILSQPSAARMKAPPKVTKQGRATRQGTGTSIIQKHLADNSDYAMHFNQALDHATAVQSMPPGISSVSEAHLLTDLGLKNQLALGALALTSDCKDNATDSLVKHLEHGRNHASALGYATIQAERMLRDTPGGRTLLEPVESSEMDLPTNDFEYFKREYIDIIPSNWHVVSISLSEDRNELRLGTFESYTVPLVLSIPLNRRTNEGTEMEFTFDHGKKELLRIINLANFSSHEGADLTKKGGKAEWWEARAALDSRLRDLLTNIENIWLGGFRGILKHCAIDTNSATKFELAFAKILDKHLPSRQARKSQKKTPVILDTQIVELFIRLGHPLDDENIDEPILDLLYFVVDILWFNGESNVCDEIDFDPIVLEIRDALITYHKTVKLNNSERSSGHTILILDKRLHSFPWESLPCMDGQSVCRLPSLYFLRQRILQMRKESTKHPIAQTIDATNGAYILNPSGDLKSTLSTFQQPLSNLTAWSSTINTEPSESDLAITLSTKSLYLYFGHGSGGQYIRSRTIRRLDHCAVALLMGCSSASLMEAGDFESHGTLLNYLHAGSPAVVGTLWDVTDKDIDRLSVKMLQKWGLFGENTEMVSPVKRNATRGKGKQRDIGQDISSGVSLDTALAQARGSCLMRYLNGAAVVVYGIPVCLK